MRQKIILVLVVMLGLWTLYERGTWFAGPGEPEAELARDQLRHAFENRLSDLQVAGSGRVTRILPDDNRGSRHQRIIVALPDGQTVLLAHNIDLAPRVENLSEGDRIDFYGEYEWNDKGGVIHWTHHDPGNTRIGGWLKHKGRVYR